MVKSKTPNAAKKGDAGGEQGGDHPPFKQHANGNALYHPTQSTHANMVGF